MSGSKISLGRESTVSNFSLFCSCLSKDTDEHRDLVDNDQGGEQRKM